MKAKTNTRDITRILALFGLILGPIYDLILRFFTPRRLRDILAFLMGVLAAVIFFRVSLPTPIETPVEDPVATPQPTMIVRTVTTNPEAANIARVLYGVRSYHLSEDAKLAIIETIFSRVDCTYGEFGDTVNEVCLKPQQWEGFVQNSSYLREDYDLALAYINGDHTARVTPEGCYWFVVSEDGVTVRTKFEGGNTWTIE